MDVVLIGLIQFTHTQFTHTQSSVF